MADQDTTHAEAARKRLAEEQKVTDRIKADAAARLKGKPTPTQEENDLAALGQSFVGQEHEPDGSDLDPNVRQVEGRHLEHSRGGGYQTRQSTAQHRSSASSSSSS